MSIDGAVYYEHRLAWVYMKGDDQPMPRIDHRDLDGTNNAWDNLRAATGSQNMANSVRRSALGLAKGIGLYGER